MIKNSAVVNFFHSGPLVKQWLSAPQAGYVQAKFKFDANLGSDVMIGIDQEWFEGTNNPIHVSGGDWMALITVTRDGLLQFPYSLPENLAGAPSEATTWASIDLNVTLKPDTWYTITSIADFGSRRYGSIGIEGEGVNVNVDLSEYALDYPNQLPFDDPILTNYVFALNSNADEADNARVLFDDVQGGIILDGEIHSLFVEDFESASLINKIPDTVADGTFITKNIQEGVWYLENPEASLQITNKDSFSGVFSLEANADLLMQAVDDEVSQTPVLDVIEGDASSNVLKGTHEQDLLYGYEGDDFLYGRKDDDVLIAGEGRDVLRGNAGGDFLYGEAGSDKLYGGSGDDYLKGGLGADLLKGGKGADIYDLTDSGTSVDKIKGFEVKDDLIFIGDVLEAYDPNDSSIYDFVSVHSTSRNNHYEMTISAPGEDALTAKVITSDKLSEADIIYQDGYLLFS